MACSSGASRQNLPRANEIVCYRLDGSLDALVVAPNLTSLDAAGGGADAYNKLPKGNLDPTGEYFVWTGNAGTGRLDAFIVRVPRGLLGQADMPRSAAPDAPIQLTATTGGNMAALSWRQAMGGPLPSYFAVAVGSEPGSSNLGHFNVGTATAASAAVPPGRYYARVFAVNQHGASRPSDEVAFTVDAPGSPPGAPRALAATVSRAVITLSWQPPVAGGTVGTYVVQAGSASGLSDVYSGAVGTLTSLTGVVPPGTYFVRIIAQNAAGTSAASNEHRVVVTPSCAAPQRPALSTSRSGNRVSAAWSVPAGEPVTHYVLQVGRTAGGSNLFNAPVGLTTSASHVMPPGTYYVRVAAVNACGASPASAEAVVQVP